MSEEDKSVFEQLNVIDVRDRIKTKNKFKYLPWAVAWEEIKKKYPSANFYIHPQIMDEYGNTRFWHDDGKSGWCEVSVTIDDLTHTEVLPIMDFRNAAIPVEQITSTEANKTMARCLTKACALHGLGLHVFYGEDLPDEITKAMELQDEIAAIVKKKVELSDAAREKVGELCKKAEKKANPELPDDAIVGQYRNINDVEILEMLKRQILAIRK